MPSYTVQPGDCLTSLAARFGLTEQAILDHANNQRLKDLGRHPNVLAAGDSVFIPDADPHVEHCATDTRHKFVVTLPKAKLRLVLVDAKGTAYAGKRYVVTVDGQRREGKSGGDGLVEVDVPPQATRGRLQVWMSDDGDEPEIDRDLAIGHLQPVASLIGVQARLANLGFSCEPTGELDDATRAALRSFRAKNGLPARDDDALVDDALRKKLRDLHEGD